MNELAPKTEAVASAVQYARTPLPVRPRLAPWATWVDLGDDRLQFRSAEFTYLTLRHPFFIDVFHRIAPLLDGRHSLPDVTASGGEEIQPTTIAFILQMLAANGLLQAAEADAALSPDELAHWDRQLRYLSRLTADPAGMQLTLRQARIGLAASDELGDEIAAQLGSLGVGEIVKVDLDAATKAFDGIDLVVAGEESPGYARFDALNTVCLETGARWLHVAMAGTSARLGPTFIPFQTACYTCYDLRLRAHEPELDGFAAYREQPNRDEGMLAPLRSIVAAQAALEAVRLLTGFAPPTTLGRFYEIDARTPVAVGHEVLRAPRCPSCTKRGPVREAWESAPVAVSGWR
jgi:bacteriocin biosynthesis cyclodehydratase domain-containing protein